jgi:predicted membrane-bound mannosyltransferase/DNA-binding beta-propeller fold protein YncE
MSEMIATAPPTAPAEGSPTERLLGRTLRVNWELVGWLALLAATLATRLWFLGQRAMSHDESLHTFYSWRLFNGEGYVHDPMMHGPLLYHLTALMYFLFGVSDYTARLISVAFGLGLVLSPLLVRRYLGPVGAWLAGLMLVISPTVLYYSRYIRHDIHVEFCMVVLFASLFRFLDTRNGSWLIVTALAAAGGITSAEMSYIVGFVLVVTVALALLSERIGPRGAGWLAVVLASLGLGLLIFGVAAALGALGPTEKGTLIHSAMQGCFLFGGLGVVFGLAVGLVARFGTAPTRFGDAPGPHLRDFLPLPYLGGEGSSSPAILGISGAVVVGFGYALTMFLVQYIQGSAQVSCGPGAGDARCVLVALLGIGLATLGFLLVLLAVAAMLVRSMGERAHGLIFGGGLVALALGLGAYWYQHARQPAAEGAVGAYIAPDALRVPQMLYLVDGLVIAGALFALYGLLAWFLERDTERGLAEAFGSAPAWSVALAVIAFLVVYVLVFTTFFSNPKGIFGFWDSVKYWLEQHDVIRGDQPWYYYGIFAPMYEFWPLLLALGAILLYARRPALRLFRGNEAGSVDNPEPGARLFVPLLVAWTLGVFWIFSWAGEKMPWLLVHLVVPMALLGGRLVADLADHVDWAAFRARGWQLAGLLLLLVLSAGAVILPFAVSGFDAALANSLPVLGLVVVAALGYGVWTLARSLGRLQSALIAALTLVVVLGLLNTRVALSANYVNDELATEYIVYAHGTPDDKLVYDTLRDLQERVGVDEPLQVVYDNDVSWPFTWYFRNSDWAAATYLGEKPSGPINADVALVGSANYGNYEPYLGKQKYVSTEFTRMWWPNEGYKGLTLERLVKAVTDPKERRNWLNILMYRRYTKDPQAETPEPKPLTDWYHHSNMKMYVKKDLIEKAWPLVQARPEWLQSLASQAAAVTVQELKLSPDAQLVAPDGSAAIAAPKDVAVGPDGGVFVVDHGNHRVLAFGPDGGFLRVVGDGELITEPQAGQAQEPSAWGIGVGPDGSVYVADTWNHRVVHYDASGRRANRWGTFGSGLADRTAELTKFYGPRDVAVAPNGDLYVTDTGNSRILVFGPDGTPKRAIVDAGADLGPFLEPTSLAFDPATGELYVADLWNKRIVRFKADMTPDVAWPLEAWDSQEAAHKAYLAVGPGGVVVFSDPQAQRVWIYSRDGRPLGTLDLPMDPNGLEQPIGVAVDDQGRVVVAASATGAVTRYQAPDVITGAASASGAGPSGGEAGDAAGQAASPSPSPSPTAAALDPGAAGADEPLPSATGQGPAPNPPPGQP